MIVAAARNCVVPQQMSADVWLQGEFLVHTGERVALIGPNGSGKTTLLLLLAGLLRHKSGEVQVFGDTPNIRSEKFRSRLGLLLQHPDDQLLAPTVFQDVALGLRALGWPTAHIKVRVDEVLCQLGISHLRERAPHHLSGGEKKMVALAGAMVHQPKLLLLDEPFAGLDGFAIVAMVKALTTYIAAGNGSVVISSHDLEGLSAWADRVYVVSQGMLSKSHSVADILAMRSRLREEEANNPDFPAVYSRLLVERLGRPCYNA